MGLALVAVLWLVGAPPKLQDADCLACHGETELRTDGGHSLFVDEARYRGSVHGELGCTGCHEGALALPHRSSLRKVECGSCHEDAVRDLKPSVHEALDVPDRPSCASCHGPVHELRPARDASSPAAKPNLAGTCGSCHSNPDFLARHEIPFARPVEAYRLSVHGRAVAAGNERAPSCTDCHGSHGILPPRNPESKINHWRVPQTCGSCHTEIVGAYGGSVHGRAVGRGVAAAPVCTDCHGEHTILAPSEAQSLVNPARVSTVTCGRCHGDERLAERYSLPLDKVPAFEDSYHGLALRSGNQTVANCASCHGVHNILPSGDPRSTIHPVRLSSTCGTCHPGAGARFAIGPVHVRPATRSEHAVVRWIRIAYRILIPLTLAFMLLHNAIDFLAKLARGVGRREGGEQIERMNLAFRVAHAFVVVSFPVLVVTGFALKFPEAFWAAPILHWEGRFAFRGWLHRIAGVVLVAALVYHGIHLILVRRDRAILRHVRPRLQDFADLRRALWRNLGLSRSEPRFRVFSYAEKLEYWAFLWGTVVMALSGFLLWFNNVTLRHFPSWVSDAATVLHYYEAILATLSILVWHLYMVIFDPEVYPMDGSWLTGRASAEHVRRRRPAYYRLLFRRRKPPPSRSDG